MKKQTQPRCVMTVAVPATPRRIAGFDFDLVQKNIEYYAGLCVLPLAVEYTLMEHKLAPAASIPRPSIRYDTNTRYGPILLE
jgi:hypothetical protein